MVMNTPLATPFESNAPMKSLKAVDGTLPEYLFAWKKIMETNPALVKGLKVGHEKFTFAWQEYERDGGNRGVLLAFYRLEETHSVKT